MAFRIKEGRSPKNNKIILNEVASVKKVEGLTPSLSPSDKIEYNTLKATTPKLRYLTEQFLEAERELEEFREQMLKQENHLKSKLEHMEKVLMKELDGYDGIEISVPGGNVKVLKSSFSKKYFNQNLFRKENPDMFKKYYELRTYPHTKVVRNTIYDKPISKMMLNK